MGHKRTNEWMNECTVSATQSELAHWAQSECVRSWLDKRVQEAISGSQRAAAEYVLGPRRIAKCQSESSLNNNINFISLHILLVLLFKLNLAKSYALS